MKAPHNLYGKKLLSLPILLLLILSLLSALSVNMTRVSAGEYPAIYIEPATTVNPDLTPGKNFTVSIYTDCIGGPKDILEIGDITGYQFTLYYNPDVLHGGIEIDDADTWTGDGDKKTFYTTEKPVPESERVYVNETLMTRDVDYYITYDIGNITFTLQPTDIWTGNGTDHIFYTTGKPIVPDSEKVYVNGTLMARVDDYYITYDEGRIWFGTKKHPKPPGVGAEIKATYLYPYPPGVGAEIKAIYLYNGVVNGDLITKEEHSTHYPPGMDVCSAVFSAGTFDNTEGKLKLTAGYFREVEWTAGPGTLANVTFTVVGKGTSNITIGPETRLYGWDYSEWEKYDIINAETEPTHIQHGYFDNRLQHDVAVVSVTAQAEAVVESLVSINVTVANIGKSDEDEVEVAVSYDGVSIDSQNVPLAKGENTTRSFSWDTTGLAQRTYTINATATIPVDDDPTDNWNTTTFLVAHDVAVVSVTTTPRAEAPVEFLVSISVEVENIGAFTEVANVTISYDSTLIGFNDTVVIPAQNSTIVPFDWNTKGLAQGNYTINATATIPDDRDLTNNWNTITIRLVAYDVAVVSVTAPAKAPVESLVHISVEVANEGAFLAEANVTISYDSTLIGFNDTVMLPAQSSMIVPFDWDTTGVAADTYTINATARLMNKTDTWTALGINKTDTWIGNGTQTTFITTQKPVVQDSEKVYVNQTLTTRITNTTDTWIGNGTQTTFITTQKPVVQDSEEVYLQFTDTWIGNGTQTTFNTTQKPVVQDSEKVYVNQTIMTKPENYTIDYVEGNITFTTAPGLGANVTAIYRVAMTKDVDYYITYDTGNITFTTAPEEGVGIKVTYQYVNYTIEYDTGEITFITAPGLGANVTAIYLYLKKSFVTTGKPVVQDSEKVYVNQTIMTRDVNYTIDYKAGNITFTTAPGLGANVTAIYLPVDMDPTDNCNTTTILIVEHDVAVGNVTAPDKATPGDIVSINVTVANIGASPEVANVTISYDSTLIGFNDTVVIPAQNSTIVPFDWNTTDVVQGIYTINATATIPVDDDPTDNCNTTTILIAKHDVAAEHISTSPLSPVYIGELVTIRVMVKNHGWYNETSFNVTVEVTHDTTSIIEKSESVPTLNSEASDYIEFSWDTTGITPGYYTITAKTVLEGDENPSNDLKTKPIVVNLPPGAIAGTVTDSSTGDPIEGANVTANGYSDTTDANGNYNITGVPAGTYNVTASANGYQTSSQTGIVVDAGETTTVNFELTIPGTITGTVTDASTGDPIAGTNVTADGNSATTDANGTYTIDNVSPGTYTVTASAAKYVNQSKPATVTTNTTTTLDFELTPLNGTIYGIVTDASTGDPVSGATVTANGVSVSTGADGSYSIELAPGTYTVTASANGYDDSSQTDITVVAEETTTLDFELTPAQPLNILLYAGVAAVAIIIIGGIAVYILKFRKPT